MAKIARSAGKKIVNGNINSTHYLPLSKRSRLYPYLNSTYFKDTTQSLQLLILRFMETLQIDLLSSGKVRINIISDPHGRFIGERQMVIGDPNLFIGDPNLFIADPNLFIEDPKFSLETPKFFLKTQYFHWRPPDFHWKLPYLLLETPKIFIGDPTRF